MRVGVYCCQQGIIFKQEFLIVCLAMAGIGVRSVYGFIWPLGVETFKIKIKMAAIRMIGTYETVVFN